MLEAGILGSVAAWKTGGEGLCDQLGMKSEEKETTALELVMRLGALDLRSNRRGVGLPSAYLLLWEKRLLGCKCSC